MDVPCPHCKKKTPWEDNPWRPFCSERCRLIDLGCWIEEDYRIAGDPAPVADDDVDYNV